MRRNLCTRASKSRAGTSRQDGTGSRRYQPRSEQRRRGQPRRLHQGRRQRSPGSSEDVPEDGVDAAARTVPERESSLQDSQRVTREGRLSVKDPRRESLGPGTVKRLGAERLEDPGRETGQSHALGAATIVEGAGRAREDLECHRTENVRVETAHVEEDDVLPRRESSDNLQRGVPLPEESRQGRVEEDLPHLAEPGVEVLTLQEETVRDRRELLEPVDRQAVEGSGTDPGEDLRPGKTELPGRDPRLERTSPGPAGLLRTSRTDPGERLGETRGEEPSRDRGLADESERREEDEARPRSSRRDERLVGRESSTHLREDVSENRDEDHLTPDLTLPSEGADEEPLDPAQRRAVLDEGDESGVVQGPGCGEERLERPVESLELVEEALEPRKGAQSSVQARAGPRLSVHVEDGDGRDRARVVHETALRRRVERAARVPHHVEADRLHTRNVERGSSTLESESREEHETRVTRRRQGAQGPGNGRVDLLRWDEGAPGQYTHMRPGTDPHSTDGESGETQKSAYTTTAQWGILGMLAGALAGAAPGTLLAYTLVPDDSTGWDDLGRIIIIMAAAVLGALGLGAYLLAKGLKEDGHQHGAKTAMTMIPTAVLLGAVTGGIGALAAPLLARWIVEGFTKRQETREGYGPAGTRTVAEKPGAGEGLPGALQREGLPQRLVVTLAAVGIGATLLLGKYGYELGGRVNGEAYVWAVAALPALLVPALLLRKHLAAPGVAGLTAALALLVGLGVPGATASARSTPERLQKEALQVEVPPGQEVVQVVTAATPQFQYVQTEETHPVVIIQTTAVGSEAMTLPAALDPGPDGLLTQDGLSDRGPRAGEEPGGSREILEELNRALEEAQTAAAAPATPTGEAAARAYTEALKDAGWEVDEYSTPEYKERLGGPGPAASWLPQDAAVLLEGDVIYGKGPWDRVGVLPYGDGLVAVYSQRP